MQAANRAVHAQAEGDSQYEGMGTTLTVAAIVGLDLTLGHVGDSRAYLVRAASIEQLTQDHTLAGELARVAGGRNVVRARRASSHVLTRCIGAQPDVQVDLSPRPIHLEDGTRSCCARTGSATWSSPRKSSDSSPSTAPAEACDALIELARARGGPDNITVIVGRVDKQR